MKKLGSLILALLLSGCGKGRVPETRAEVLQAYSEAGARLLPKDFRFTYLGRDLYTIDRYLTLTERAEFQFSFAAEITGSGESLKEGEPVKVRILFLSSPEGDLTPSDGAARSFKDKRFLTQYEAQTAVGADSRISVVVPLLYQFTEEPFVESRLEILVDLQALDRPEISPLLAGNYFAPFENGGDQLLPHRGKPFDDVARELIPAKSKLQTLAYGPAEWKATVKKPVATWEQSPYEMLRQSLGKDVAEIDISQGADPGADNDARVEALGWSRDELYSLLTTGTGTKKSTAKKGGPFPQYHASVVTVVDEAHGRPRLRQRQSLTYWQLSAQFFNEKGIFDRDSSGRQSLRSTEKSQAGFVRSSAVSEGRVGWFTPFSRANVGVEAASGYDGRYGVYIRDQEIKRYQEHGTLSDHRSRITFGENGLLYPEELVVGMDLTMRRCLHLSPRAEGKGVPHLICARFRDSNATERWYYVRDFDPANRLALHKTDMRERMWMLIVRGTQPFEKFKRELTQEVSKAVVQSADSIGAGVFPLIKDAILRGDHVRGIFVDGGIYPGVLAQIPVGE